MLISLANTVSSFTAFGLSAKSISFSSRFGIKKSSNKLLTPVCDATPSSSRDEASVTMDKSVERSEADKLVDRMSFEKLCDEFEGVSNPSVEATVRQLVRDILAMREGNRALGTFAISVKYKDPLRSFTGREKYKRATWIRDSLDNPSVAVQEMAMKSTSKLNVKWVLRGRPKFASFGDFSLVINSTFTLNQVNGVVMEHVEEWDLSRTSLLSQLYFWISRLAYAASENGKDAFGTIIKGIDDKVFELTKSEDSETIYRDPKDPTKFYQIENNPQRDLYQIGLFVALIYLVVQFLKETL